jgi:chromate transporter
MDPTTPEPVLTSVTHVSLRESFWTWCRVATLSFGGPAGQIAVMHRIIVDEKKWVSENRFLHALNYCMLLPGPEAQQLATYIGWLMHRSVGGLMAGILFVLPGFISILALSIVYARFQEATWIQALFFGLKPAVMAIVLEAVLRIGKRILKNATMFSLAVASFIAIFFFNVPFPVLIFAAGIIGFIGGRIAPVRFSVIRGHGKAIADDQAGPRAAVRADARPTLLRSINVSIVCLTLWFAPLVVVGSLLGSRSVLFQEGIFFSKAAVVTFGGAYSVLAYIAQQAVEKYLWLKPGEMLDGLGMAETTPGPLIMVVQFVAFLGAYRNPGPFHPLAAGILGSVMTTWVTFVPCFFWIFLGATYVERLRGNRLLNAALSAITAAVVGVVLNLAVWFSLHTLFGRVHDWQGYGLNLLLPELSSIRLQVLGIAILAVLLMFYWKKGMAVTLAASAAAGAVLHLATG